MRKSSGFTGSVLVTLGLLGACVPASASAQVRFLVPLNTTAEWVPGGEGSAWGTELWARNEKDESVGLRTFSVCPILGCTQVVLPPRTTTLLDGAVGGLAALEAAIVGVDASDAANVHFALGVREISSEDHFVAQVPVVRESDFFEREVQFVRVPVRTGRRISLRLYDPYALGSASLRLQVFDEHRATLFDRTVEISGPAAGDPWPDAPNYLFINNLGEFIGDHDAEFLRILLTPVTPGIRFWAFVSTTDVHSRDVDIILAN